jgi:hypothetical protein
MPNPLTSFLPAVSHLAVSASLHEWMAVGRVDRRAMLAERGRSGRRARLGPHGGAAPAALGHAPGATRG